MKKDRAIVIGVKGLFVQACAMLCSLKHNITVSYDLIVLHEGLTKFEKAVFTEIFGCTRFIEYTKFKKPCARFEQFHPFSHMTMARYECFELLQEYRQVLWLDVDIIVRRNIDAIFGYTGDMCVVWEHEGDIRKNFSNPTDDVLPEKWKKNDSFNAGVFLLNGTLPNPIATKEFCEDTTYDLMYRGMLKYPDQGVLNLAILRLGIKVTAMDPRYDAAIYFKGYDVKNSDPYIYHFLTLAKPWLDRKNSYARHGVKFTDEWLSWFNYSAKYVQMVGLEKENLWPRIYLLSTIGKDFRLLRSFMRHYSNLGITRFLIILNTDSPSEEKYVNDILSEFSISVVRVWPGVFTEIGKIAVEQEVVKLHCKENDWVLYADLDEFQDYPKGLKNTLDSAEKSGYTCVKGEFVDRISRTGNLPAWDGSGDLEAAFPVRCQITKNILLGNATKIVAAKASVKVHWGHHTLQDELTGEKVPLEQLDKLVPPFVIKVDHYKWDSHALWKLSQRSLEDCSEKAWIPESNRALEYLKKHGRFDLSDPLVGVE